MFVFPMAGLSRRFQVAGYSKPKFQLEAHGGYLFDYSVSGFNYYFHTHDFLFIMRPDDDTPDFVRGRTRALGLPEDRTRIALLEGPTEGQAETVALGFHAAGGVSSAPLTIFNIDTLRRGFRFPDVATSHAGYLEVFRGPGEHWSFVEPEGNPAAPKGRVRSVAEKVRISDLCSTGLYHFARAQDFLAAFSEVRATPASDLQGGERYVAPLYNRLIVRGDKIGYQTIPDDQVTFYGTPTEYDAFRTGPSPRDVLPPGVTE